ncbi:cytochrome P450 [Actinomycetospora sp. NBRC 106378]|uniref:cytochrome P450 n=1 Tax=Actinomycetospora sp. NBRC 106378 TaxID=3032208 RepID=UPI0024A545B4|nr:cytochrome P450 [Actinomycetospora sp. NBRC 106378]GLZ52143.1 cytochrome P450 [Actinomycetospora sp. NBRC 106378]
MSPVDLDPYAADLTEPTVWEVYEAAREAGPVAWSDRRGGFWVVTGYDDVRAVLRDAATFSSASGHRIPTDGTQRAVPIDFDPPLHTGYRKLMTPVLSPARVRALRPFLERTISELVRAFATRGGGDFVTEVALPLPLAVLTELVGFAPSTVERFREVTEQMWSGLDADGAAVDFVGARQRVYDLMADELAAHRSDPVDDVVGSLLTAEVDGRALDEDERISILATFAVAGHETTMNAASTLVHLLVAHPEHQRRLRADPERAPAYVEEMLRHRSPAQNFARRATCPASVAGHRIAEGDAVLLSLAAANRDPERFADPACFDPDRDARGHLGFGWGIHQCPGGVLARTELAILLRTLGELPPLHLDGEVTWSGLQGGNHLGPTRLPIRFATDGA